MYKTFEEYIKYCKENNITLECPLGCSAYGFLCNGNPYETPCGYAIEIDANDNY